MITNKFLLITIGFIILLILINKNNEPFTSQIPLPKEVPDVRTSNNQYLNTPIRGLTLEFKENRPFQKDIKYGKSFDDLRKQKPLLPISEDKLFNDIVPYDNQADGRLGLDICLERCNGECVEFGQTGNAYCFPNEGKMIAISTYFEALRDNSYSSENTDEAPQKLLYPNLR